MVSTKKALVASGISAVLVGAAHYLAHSLAPPEHAVIIAGSTVVLATFLIGFGGMKLS